MNTATAYSIREGEAFDLVMAETPNGAPEVRGHATPFAVEVLGDHRLDVLYIRAENGERWIEARRVESSSPWLRNLDGRLRLIIQRASGGERWCELRQARRKDGGWSNLFNASLEELDAGVGDGGVADLRSAGATALGTREEVLGDTSSRRRANCVQFLGEDERVPVVAFVITRVLPLVETG